MKRRAMQGIILPRARGWCLLRAMSKRLEIVVVGAGMVGVSAAIWLLRAGHAVTLVDRDEPGRGASWGNAGLLAQWAVVPVTTPGLIRHLPGYLLSANSPLFLRWSYLLKIAPWLWRFLAHANAADAERAMQGLVPLLGDAVEQHKRLAEGTRAAARIADSDFAYVYRDRAAFEADAEAWAMRARAGMEPELLEGGAVREAEPMLSDRFNLLAVLKGHGHILFPGDYVAELAADFAAAGGRVVRAEVRDLDLAGGRIVAVDTDRGRFACDRAVITAGIWSKALMRRLGLDVPLEAERGYHVTYRNAAQLPRTPMMMTEGKFGVTPMGTDLRCAGTVELGGIEAGPSKAPIRLLRRFTAAAFPGLTAETTEEWMGFRPSTPDSLPLIGEVGSTGIFAGFGHQHVGLTSGPKTGRMIADLIAGRRPNIDLGPYDPQRFRG